MYRFCNSGFGFANFRFLVILRSYDIASFIAYNVNKINKTNKQSKQKKYKKEKLKTLLESLIKNLQ